MTDKLKPMVIACIPAYNEEKYIAKVIVETKKYVDRIIVCDDGSKDSTGEIAKQLGAIVIRHRENMGYGAALRSLFKKALELKPDIVVTLDADGQHDPREIPRLIEPIINGEADIVIGSRFLGKTTQSKWRTIGVKTITKTVKITFSIDGLTDAQSGFRAYKASILKELIPEDNTMAASIEILAKAKDMGLRIKEVPATIIGHEEANTQNPIMHFAVLIAKTIQYVAEKHPLLLLGVPGILVTLISLIGGIVLLSGSASIYGVDIKLFLLFIVFLVIGLTLISLSIILYALARLKQFIESKI